ncbi:MAG TPA: CBS domain-containing protein [Rhodospirillales bacterium]|nr:CBS domain-containing protein [Rhodospirillales bacterium]
MPTYKNNTMRVSEVMMLLERIPVIRETVIMKEAFEEMGRLNLGIACIVDVNMKLLGILTDGDIRRKLLKVQKPFAALLVDDALEYSIRSPITIHLSDTLVHGVDIMGLKQVWDLPVVDNHGVLVGLLHLHPAVQALLGVTK